MRDCDQKNKVIRRIMAKQSLVTLRLNVLGFAILISGAAWAETPGEHFEKAMKRLAENCTKAKLRPGETGCDILKLKPADPLATQEGRFAHSLKIPNPVSEDSGYKPGMTPEQYFDHLCKTEAREFVYKTAVNVEGLYQMRLREPMDDYMLEHLYAMEDPYGVAVGVRNHPEEYFVQPAIGKYVFLETPLPKDANVKEGMKYRRYYRDEKSHPGSQYPTAINGQFVQVPYIVATEDVSTLKSRYGYTWRGIIRVHDREFGIAGGELIVFDLQTNEVLGVRRSFVRTGSVLNNLTGVWWLTAGKCSKEALKTDAQFINEVLKPTPQK